MTTEKPFRIVAAVDVDDTAHSTWGMAAALMANPKAEVSLLHVIRASEREVRNDTGEISALVEEGHRQVQAMLAEELGDASHPLRERVDIYVGVGEPSAQIIQLAVDLEADLIIVGTNDRKGLERMMLGSVSSGVFKRAPCSVLVARSSHFEGLEKTPVVEPPLAEGQQPMIRAGRLVRYRSLPFSSYNANLFPTGIPRRQVF